MIKTSYEETMTNFKEYSTTSYPETKCGAHTVISTRCITNTNQSRYHSQCTVCHQILLLLVEHRASMKSFQALRSPAIPLTSFHDFLCFLSHPLLSFATFSSAYLSFYIPEYSNLMQSSLFLLFLYVMCAQSNSIFFFLSNFLLTSDG